MDGVLSIEGDDLHGLLAIIFRNRNGVWSPIAPARIMAALRHIRRRLDQSNPEAGARRNVAHHYDLTPAIYDLFLDADRQYSCAYFAQEGVAATLKDDRFVRMWRYYLAASEQTFRHGPQDVFQFQLCRRPDAVPITRDYLYAHPDQRLAQAAE
jgi:hypothetical protein